MSTIDRSNANPLPARMIKKGDRVLAGGAFQVVSTIGEAGSDQVHFRTEDERHFLTGRNTTRWVEQRPV